jgi:superfamily II DNA helicase RecQ
VSELVVYFLWLVLPFVEAIQLSHLDQGRLSTYLWEANYGHVTVDAADYSISRMGYDDNDINDDDGEIEDISPAESSIWADKSSLAAKRPQPLNSDGLYSSERLRRLMHAEFARHGLPQLGVQDWRHAYPAIQRQISRNSVAANTLEVLYFDGQPLANFQARASGHTERTEANTYGRDIHEGHRFTPDDRVRYRAVSVDWHLYLQFPSVFSPRNPDLNDQGLMAEHHRIKEREKARWLSMAHADMRQELRIFTGNPRAEFRPGQKEALRAIFKRTPRLLAIMATGSGKSSLFTLPAMHPQAGTTIVVVPTTALKLDLKRRALPTGLTCAAYEGANDELPEGAKLVFVTPESATSLRFIQEYVEPLRALGQLDRIVIDECHVVLESVEDLDWRPRILELSELQGKGIQLVYLTGSLAPRDMPTFFKAIGLRESDVIVLRQHTTRPNISYSVCGVLAEDGENPKHAYARYIATEMTKHPQADQALVYCQQIERGTSIANLLNTAMYHGKLPLRTKARLLASFTKGEMQVMVATNAMGQGVDLDAVKIVFHVGPPALLRDFVQESGRAGRDGRSRSKSIILMLETRTQQGEIRRAKPLQRTEASMVDFVQLKDGCRRQIIDEIMDGTPRLGGCRKGEIDCENCERSRQSTTRTGTGTEVGAGAGAATSLTTTITAKSSTLARMATVDQRQTNEYEIPRLEQGNWTCLPTPASIGRTVAVLAAQTAASKHVDTTPPPVSNILAQKRVACSSPSPTILHGPDPTDTNVDIDIRSPTKKQKGLEEDEEKDKHDEDEDDNSDDDSEDYGSSELDMTEVERLNDNIAKQLVQDRKRRHVEQQSFEEMIKVWHNHCPICLVTKDEENKHIWTQCPGNNDKVSHVEEYIRGFRIKTVFNLEVFAGCFHCLMPLELCQAYDWTSDKHGKPCFKQNRRPCQYDKTVPVAMASIALFGDEKTHRWIRKQARSWVKTGSITLSEHNTPWWLGRKKRWGLLRHCNNICYTVWAYDQGKMKE